MVRIRIVKSGGRSEKFYKTFAEIVSIKENAIVLFDYLLLQELFHVATYNEIDFDKSIIRYSDDEKYDETRIYLKSGMKLKFERVRISNQIYALTTMSFSWKNCKYKYNAPEKPEEVNEMYLVMM